MLSVLRIGGWYIESSGDREDKMLTQVDLYANMETTKITCRDISSKREMEVGGIDQALRGGTRLS